MILTTQNMEAMLSRAQMSPEFRQEYKGYTIFIGDGFSLTPERHYQKFGVNGGDYPLGAFCTIWLLGQGEKIAGGEGLVFDAAHDAHASSDARKEIRVKQAMAHAVEFIDRMDRIKREGVEGTGRLLHA